MIVAISGVHGVGKSTLVRVLCTNHRVEPPPERPPNPFRKYFLSFMFYLLAFNERDTWASQRTSVVFVDRHSIRDILVDTWTVYKMGLLNGKEVETILETCRRVLLSFEPPAWAILLDDDVGQIMSRIKARPLPAGHLLEHDGHLLEYDETYLRFMIANFRREFESEAITVGEFGMKVAGRMSTIMQVNGQQPDALAEVISAELKRVTFGAFSTRQ